jgi:hypothetical protein
MTETDCETILAILLAEDVQRQRHLERMHALAQFAMREAPTAETRTEARIRVLALEKAMVGR